MVIQSFFRSKEQYFSRFFRTNDSVSRDLCSIALVGQEKMESISGGRKEKWGETFDLSRLLSSEARKREEKIKEEEEEEYPRCP